MKRVDWRSASGGTLTWSGGEAFTLDDDQIAQRFGARLGPRTADLLEIAMECYAIDRLTKRSLTDGVGRGWCRTLPVTLAVRDLDFWNDQEVSAALHGLLDWLTDDEWQPLFVARRYEHRAVEDQTRLFSLPPDGPAAVGCFSAGLDSFGGAAIDLAEPDQHLVLIGAYGVGRAGSRQHALGDALAAQTGRVESLVVRAHLLHAKHRAQDSQQRTRGLLFLSLAAAAAILAGVDEVRLYENGIGAINLPYNRSQSGAQMARSAHPRTLLAMQRLVALMDEGTVRFRAPRMFDTKGELVARIPVTSRELAKGTYSCDSWATVRQPRGEGRPLRCGACSSCLLRRQALHAAGWAEVDRAERCQVDAFADDAPLKATRWLRLMLTQVADIEQALVADNPWTGLVARYPELVVARDALVDLGERAVEDRLVALYAQYAREWREVPSPLVDRYLGQDGVR